MTAFIQPFLRGLTIVLMLCTARVWAGESWIEEPQFAQQQMVMAKEEPAAGEAKASSAPAASLRPELGTDNNMSQPVRGAGIGKDVAIDEKSLARSAEQQPTAAPWDRPLAASVLNQLQLVMVNMGSLSAKHWSRDAQYMADYFTWPAWQQYYKLMLDANQGYLRAEVLDRGYDSVALLLGMPEMRFYSSDIKDGSKDQRFPEGHIRAHYRITEYGPQLRKRLFEIDIAFVYRPDNQRVLITDVAINAKGPWGS